MASESTMTGVLVTAAIAALGFVGKELWVIVKAYVDEKRRRHGDLVQLFSLLRASGQSFDTQADHRNSLYDLIHANHPEIPTSGEGESYDDFFARAYPSLNEKERELHAVIRGITMHALRPLNQALLKWVQKDRYFKGASDPEQAKLARKLAQLEVHLLHWLARYETWVLDERRALVYLADENAYGLGFPTGIDALVETAIYGDGGAPDKQAEP